MSVIRDDIVRRAVARVIESFDEVRPLTPYSIKRVVVAAAGEPAVMPMVEAQQRLDRNHPEWHLEDRLLRSMAHTAGSILRGSDSRGRRTHGRIQWRGNEAALWCTILVFNLDQIRAMRIGGRRYERHVKLRNDGLEELEELMETHQASAVADVWDLWNPEDHVERGEAI